MRQEELIVAELLKVLTRLAVAAEKIVVKLESVAEEICDLQEHRKGGG